MRTAPSLYAHALTKKAVVLVWLLAWLLMWSLDGLVDLAHLALLLVLASAVCGLWLSATESLLVGALAVMAFDWQFVPPRGKFTVDLREHIWLLLTMLAVGSMVAWLVGRQRAFAESARVMAEHATLLRSFNEQLRGDSADAAAQRLATVLERLTQAQVAVVMLDHTSTPTRLRLAWGQASDDDMAQLHHCLDTAPPLANEGGDMPGHQPITLALRGPTQVHGAVLLRLRDSPPLPPATQATAQALCHQLGAHCEHALVEARARWASEEAQTQKVRNTLLAAISHDYRTPLATILGAASSLLRQSDRLSRAQTLALVTTIINEVEQLSTMTDNTLQLARLDAQGVQITKDWESLEELVGSAVARTRRRYPNVHITVDIEPQLPLLRCDAQLLVQLLDNLIDNAVKYGHPDQNIHISARQTGEHLLMAVGDRGNGIPASMRDRLFLPFERGPHNAMASGQGAPRGAGLGLALCRAIVVAHGGSIVARQRHHGGTSMECRFPLEHQPPTSVEFLPDSPPQDRRNT